MNGKTCQLCGKPLSRIWAGSGGDFCSREHRNQYRLRCGMDTLLEANKHASLMRRRDQPRQFTFAGLTCNSAISPRECGPFAPPPGHPSLRAMPPVHLPALGHLDTGRGGQHKAAANPAPSAARPKFAPNAGFAGIHKPVPLPVPDHASPAGFPQAGSARDGGLFRRNAGNPCAVLLPAQFPGKRKPRLRQRVRALDIDTAAVLSGRRARPVRLIPQRGNAFRISAANAFQRPGFSFRPTRLPVPEARGMVWPQCLPPRASAYIGQAVPPSSLHRDFAPREAVAPASPARKDPEALQTAPPVYTAARAPHDAKMDSRLFGALTRGGDRQPLLAQSTRRAGKQSMRANNVKLKLVPAAAVAERRLEKAPFEPQDQACITVSYSWNASK